MVVWGGSLLLDGRVQLSSCVLVILRHVGCVDLESKEVLYRTEARRVREQEKQEV